MRNLIITLAIIFTYNFTKGQNLIANPSFETPAVTGDYPTDLAQADKLANWQSRTYIQYVNGAPFNTWHSPDWMKEGSAWRNSDPFDHVIIATTGDAVVFTAPEEILQQHLSNTLGQGLYHFSANVLLYSSSTSSSITYDYNSSYKYYFRLRFSKNEMTYQSEDNQIDVEDCSASYRNLSGSQLLEYYIPINLALVDQWQKIEINSIKMFHTGYDWIGFDLVVFDDNNNERICSKIGIDIDDVDLSRDCCGDFIFYQNISDKLPRLTQRSRFIAAGEDVHADNMSVGPVIVLTDSFVKFRAGEFISLEPGFQTQPGAHFETEIAPCGNEPDPNYNFNIAFDYANQLAALNCSSPYLAPLPGNNVGTNAAFYSSGAGWYWVIIKDNHGAIIFEDIAPIHSAVQEYWNGANSAYFTNLNGVAEVNISISNCQNSVVKDYTVTYEYLSGCEPSNKKEEDSITLTNNEQSVENNILLFPNPFNNQININTNDVILKSDLMLNGWQYKISDNLSKQYFSGITFGNIKMDNFIAGTYYISIYTNEKVLGTYKIVKL